MCSGPRAGFHALSGRSNIAPMEDRRRLPAFVGRLPRTADALAYFGDCLRMLEERIPDSSLVALLRAELATSAGTRLGVAAASISP